jgi:hypothetical protein
MFAPFGVAHSAEQQGKALEGPEGKILGTLTGFHSVRLKKSDFEARLLEADGSASVARDPISLYLVVTNNATSDLVEHTWRLSRGVARVRGLTPSACGVDVKVDVDRVAPDGRVVGRVPRVLHLCVLSPAGQLQTDLKESETSR